VGFLSSPNKTDIYPAQIKLVEKNTCFPNNVPEGAIGFGKVYATCQHE